MKTICINKFFVDFPNKQDLIMPPKKKAAAKGPRGMGKPIPAGQTMADLTKKEWKLGPVIGQGGFGYIYLGILN